MMTGQQLMAQGGLEAVDLIKIDVEGHEEAVLSTLAPVIATHRPRALVFEHGGKLDSPSAPIRQILEPLGYKIFGIQKSLMRWRLLSLADLCGSGRQAHDYVARLPHMVAG